MELDGSGDSGDLIDQRGEGGGGLGGLGGLGAGMGGGNAAAGCLPLLLGGFLGSRRGRAGGGMGTIVLLVVGFFVLRSCLGGGFDLSSMGRMNNLPGLPSATGEQLPTTGDAGEVTGVDPQGADVSFANAVITDANDMWTTLFQQSGQRYERTKLVLYSGGVNTGCGSASSAAGPFYCPADSLVYLDLSFWNELASRFGAQGDFAQAYVIAHEVGHHVQNQLGISDQVRKLEQDDPSAAEGATGLSVRTELQADCLAGVWAHTTYERDLLEQGDLEEALRAAAGVGDDTIQRSTVGRVTPDAFTHGSSEQRQHWFRRGFDSGNAEDCDTFSVDSLDP